MEGQCLLHLCHPSCVQKSSQLQDMNIVVLLEFDGTPLLKLLVSFVELRLLGYRPDLNTMSLSRDDEINETIPLIHRYTLIHWYVHIKTSIHLQCVF